MKLDGKVVVVTGGGNGIGRELVLQALGSGARATALDLRGESLAQLASAANACAVDLLRPQGRGPNAEKGLLDPTPQYSADLEQLR